MEVIFHPISLESKLISVRFKATRYGLYGVMRQYQYKLRQFLILPSVRHNESHKYPALHPKLASKIITYCLNEF